MSRVGLLGKKRGHLMHCHRRNLPIFGLVDWYSAFTNIRETVLMLCCFRLEARCKIYLAFADVILYAWFWRIFKLVLCMPMYLIHAL